MDLGGGGAERVMLNLASGFAHQGASVELVLVKAVGAYLPQIPSNIKVICLNSSRLAASLPALIHYLKSVRPSILMSALEDTNFIALWAKQIANVPTRVVVTVHNNLSRESQNAAQLKRRLTPQLVKLFYPWADHIVGVSQGVVDDLIRLGVPAQKITPIYNPIVTESLVEKAKNLPEHPWFSTEQIPVILGVGRLTKQKDFSTLIHAVALVNKQRPVRLVLLGEGEDEETLKQLVLRLKLSDDVNFLGFVENPYAYMARAKILVVSSAWEGFGNVLVEAMAVGTAVVSTDCESGPAEILENGRYGSLVEVANIEDMAKSILETLEKSVDPEILKKRANEFTLEKAVERYQEVLNTL